MRSERAGGGRTGASTEQEVSLLLLSQAFLASYLLWMRGPRRPASVRLKGVGVTAKAPELHRLFLGNKS